MKWACTWRAAPRRRGIGKVKDECRDSRGISAVETTLQDLRYGVRVLRKTPVFTAVALLLLAIGIGVNTSVITVANQVLLQGFAVKIRQS